MVSAKKVACFLGDHHVHAVDFGQAITLADDLEGRADGLRVVMIDTREQGVGIALKDHHRAKMVAAFADGATGFGQCDALALAHGEECFCIAFDQFAAGRIDDGNSTQVGIQSWQRCA